jgi:hypothetical protein
MRSRAIVICMLGLACAAAACRGDEPRVAGAADSTPIADPNQVGGEDASVVQVANLIYARVKSSKCFSDHFLVRADNESAISTSRRFHAVKLESDDVFQFPFVIMTGEGSFKLTDKERANLKKYCENGGFLLASAGCSSEEWDKSFRAELKLMWPDVDLQPLPLTHPVFHTVCDIKEIHTAHGKPRSIEGISYNGKLVVVYSEDGLNNTANVRGCCCCGGNEVANAEEINMNILAYALAF